jgi:hypothetical protein
MWHYYKSNHGTQKTMSKICNFPISESKRCRQPIADDRPNCGRHKTGLSAEQLGQNLVVYRKGGELHVWAGKPGGIYCLIHNDLPYRVLYQLSGEAPPCCLKGNVSWTDKDGYYHRDDGPARIATDGAQSWYQHGKLHRDDGPAQAWPNGTQFWCQHGKLHRNDGPAAMYSNGMQSWYWHGERVTEEEHASLRERPSGV